jgi:hypothetical protein
MAKKRRKPKNRAKLACEIMQLHARLKETDSNGNGFCFSCGRAIHFYEGQGGHFQAKGFDYNKACTDPRNIHLQCYHCNMFDEGNKAGYSLHMTKEYGEEIIEVLFLMSKQPHDPDHIEQVIKDYRMYNRELASRKTFKVNLK